MSLSRTFKLNSVPSLENFGNAHDDKIQDLATINKMVGAIGFCTAGWILFIWLA